MLKVVINILQLTVVTETMLDGLNIYPPVANFLRCRVTKNYEHSLSVDKVIAIEINSLLYFGPLGIMPLQQ